MVNSVSPVRSRAVGNSGSVVGFSSACNSGLWEMSVSGQRRCVGVLRGSLRQEAPAGEDEGLPNQGVGGELGQRRRLQ